MENITLSAVYDLLNKINLKLSKIEIEVEELKTERKFEVRPEYIQKLKCVEKEGKFHSYDDIKDFWEKIESIITKSLGNNHGFKL